jgi:antitoxin CptB
VSHRKSAIADLRARYPISGEPEIGGWRCKVRVCFTPDKRLGHRYIKLARLVRAFGVAPMTESRSNEDLDVRRRRLRFRAWHRGTREMDLLLGRFADAEAAKFDEQSMSSFEALLEVPDPDLYNWIVGAEETPAPYDTPLMRRLRDFHLGSAR